MCNLYSVTKGQSAIRDLFRVRHDRAGNLPPLPAVFPDQLAPIVRVAADGARELVSRFVRRCRIGLLGCERRRTIGHCGGEPGEGWHANIEQ